MIKEYILRVSVDDEMLSQATERPLRTEAQIEDAIRNEFMWLTDSGIVLITIREDFPEVF